MELASIQESLKNEGWYLTEAAINQLTENGQITDTQALIKKALDIDLREISEGGLPEDVNKTKYENIVGKVVLQIQKIKNLSCPKASEFNNNAVQTILKVILTDGVQSIQGVNLNVINNININTYPGSKICLGVEDCQVNISSGFILLTSTNIQFLGGQVTNLIEKWQLNRSLAKHTRDRQDDCGPPPWIPFGQKIIKQNLNDNNFKSLDLGKNKDNSENKEFEAQRKGAILEATKIGSTKVFGGGNNKLLDHNVQLIVDAGFTIEQAEYALKVTKNNADRALKNLQIKYNKNQSDPGKSSKSSTEERKSNTKGKHRYKDEECGATSKPSSKVSLFDFLEDKLPIIEKESPAVVEQHSNNNYYDRRNNGPVRGNKSNNNRGGGAYVGVSLRYQQGDKNRHGYDGRNQYNDKRVSDQPKKNYYEQKQYGNPRMSNNTITNTAAANTKENNTRRNNNNQLVNVKKDQGMDSTGNKKQNNFPEKPPRFQRQNQEQTGNVQNWNNNSDHKHHPSLQPTSYQLDNSMAGLNINMSYRNVSNTQDVSVTGANKPSMHPHANVQAAPTAQPSQVPPPNMFYDSHLQHHHHHHQQQQQQQHHMTVPPPQVVPQPDHNVNSGVSAAAAAHLTENFMKNFNYNMLHQQQQQQQQHAQHPHQQEYHYKTNGAVIPGFNDNQALLNNVRNTPATTNTMRYQPHFMTYQTSGGQGGGEKKWVWHKGDKCMARYWEDQMYYNAVVTAVSENTCVVKFVDYNNFEEVLQDHCIPITEES